MNKQQSARIEKRHQHYRHLDKLEDSDLFADGLVITRYRRHALIETEHNTLIHCSIRPSIDSLVAGDRVVWQAETDHQGVVVSRYPRDSVLGRPDHNHQLKAIAANITQMMIVVAPVPEISWMLLDSYLVVADYLQLNASIVLNKTDLACESLQQTLLKYYEPLGYPLLLTSSESAVNKHLEKALSEQTTVFVGQSGVGKSSLIQRILPNETQIQTGPVSEHSLLGCHTTSNSRLYHLPHGGRIIDSPGVREFGLWHMPIREIARHYRDFQPYLSSCKFRDCNHKDTPHCAIKNAVKNKLISELRYENYVKISDQFQK